ncbi:MAG TPA: type II secretion system protein [Kiritimatiellia bacterium]|nr:type II secretion system protein [Kiritimatiellia bacterium]
MRGFTLVELLVVMAILGILAGLVFTGARASLRKAIMIDCMSDMRQMGMAVQMFVDDNRGVLPGTSHAVSWTNSLSSYLGRSFIGRCPAVPGHRSRITYGWNDCLAPNGVGIPIDACHTPSLTMMVAELASNQSGEHFHFSGVRGGAARLTPNQFMSAVNVEAHGSSANYLFVDGHAENMSWAEVQNRLTQPNSTFVVP